jgi:hypothetical protein
LVHGVGDVVALAASALKDPALGDEFRESLAKGDSADAELRSEIFLAGERVRPGLGFDHLLDDPNCLVDQ